jgi:2-methylcitrate dehydratase PrpD
MSTTFDLNERPDCDDFLQQIAGYVLTYRVKNKEAWNTARNCLMDTVGCGLLALRFPECTKHLGPLVEGKEPLTMHAVLEAMIMAHEIQGVLALENSFNRVGLDHVVLVKVASTAVTAKLMGANREQLPSGASTMCCSAKPIKTRL